MALGWVDWALVAVLVISVLVGIKRGFVFELLSLLGWVVAWFAAQWFAADIAHFLPVGKPGGPLNHAAGFVICFLGAIIVWSLAAHIVRMLIHATPLSIPDRALGAVFGLLRGLVLLFAVATVMALTPLGKSGAWHESRGAAWLDASLHGLKPVLPEQVARLLPA